MTKYAQTIYPPRDRFVREAEAANKAERPSKLRSIAGHTIELFSLYEKTGWADATEEVPRGRLKQSTLKLVPLGTLQTRRCHRKHGNDCMTNLWLGSDGFLHEGSIDTLRRLRPKQIKSFSQLERLSEILPQAFKAAQERANERYARQPAG